MYPSIAQLVERWTVEVKTFIEIHRSLVQIRLEGNFFLYFLNFNSFADENAEKTTQEFNLKKIYSLNPENLPKFINYYTNSKLNKNQIEYLNYPFSYINVSENSTNNFY